jgi:hypothetical protein
METVMAKWYEAANEASFKPAAGGYVFQSPNPWIFVRPRYYLVNEAQKAQIMQRLGRWRLLNLALLAITFGLFFWIIWSPAMFARLFQPATQLGMGFYIPVIALVMILFVVPLVAVPHIYLMRALRPLLADAPRTNERITVAEQLPKIAAPVSGLILAIGLVGGLAMMAGSVLILLDAFLEGHLARSLLVAMPLLVFGGLLTGYFVYLLRLKAQLKRSAL